MNQIAVELKMKDLEFEDALAWGIAFFGRGIVVKKAVTEKCETKQESILLTDCPCTMQSLVDINATAPVLYLSSSREESIAVEEKGIRSVYKYQSVVNILNEISVLAADRLNMKTGSFKNDRSKLITFSSACGGAGTTTLALATAQFLRRYRSAACLYVSLETWESTDIYIDNHDAMRSVDEFLYCFREKKNVSENLSAFMCRDYYGVEAFVPSKGKNPLCEFDEIEISDFFNHIIEFGEYEYVIVDAGSSFNKASVWTMENSEKNVFISDGHSLGIKEKMVIAYLRNNTSVNLEERFIRVANRLQEAEYDNYDESVVQERKCERDEGIYFEICEDKESFINEEGRLRINIDCDLGEGISKLAVVL